MAEADGNEFVATDAEANVAPSTAGETAAASMTGNVTVGARLRAAREAAGLSVADLSTRTRITTRHVESLEAGDYAALSGRPYALGFARSYARAVGLDDKTILADLRAELDRQEPAAPPREIHQFEVGDPAKTPSRLLSWLAGVLVLIVMALGLVFWRSSYWPAAELPPLVGPSSEAAPGAQAPSAPSAPAAPAPAASGPVVFTALDDGIWVKFYDGAGVQLLQKQLAKGESWTVPAGVQEPRLWTGRPDALAITVGGQPVPRIADTQRIMKDVPVSAAALLGRAAPPPSAPSPAAPPQAVSQQASQQPPAAGAARQAQPQTSPARRAASGGHTGGAAPAAVAPAETPAPAPVSPAALPTR